MGQVTLAIMPSSGGSNSHLNQIAYGTGYFGIVYVNWWFMPLLCPWSSPGDWAATVFRSGK